MTLDVSEAKGTLQVRWLDISRSAWQEPETVDAGGTLELKTPGKGHWAVLVLASRSSRDYAQYAIRFADTLLEHGRDK